MVADALQDVDETGTGVHIVQSAGDEQPLDDPHPLGTDLGGGEPPVSFSHRYGAKGEFEVIGIDGHTDAMNPGGFRNAPLRFLHGSTRQLYPKPLTRTRSASLTSWWTS